MKKVDKKAIFGIVIIAFGIGVISYINISNTVNKNVYEFSNYISNIEEEIEKYDLGEYKERYNSLVEDTEKAINKKDIKGFDYLKEELEILRNDVKSYNTESSNKELNEIKEVNIEEIDESKKSEIEQQISEIREFISSGKIIEAKELIKEIKNDINLCLQKVKEEKEQISNIKIDRIKSLIDKNQINEAKRLLEELKEYDLDREQLNVVKSISNIINK